MTGLFVIVALVLLALYLNDSWRSLERARVVARNICARHGVQFLDGSVIRTRLRLARDGGTLVFVRSYRFEFTLDGAHRHSGHLAQRGRRLELVSMDDAQGGRVLDVAAVRGPEQDDQP
jgi:hypothetical protein